MLNFERVGRRHKMKSIILAAILLLTGCTTNDTTTVDIPNHIAEENTMEETISETKLSE